MKVRINKGLLENIALMSIPSMLAAPAGIPVMLAFSIFGGLLLHNPSPDESVEIEINPLGGMKQEVLRRQFEDYIQSLKQARAYGMPKEKRVATEILKSLGVG